MDCKIIDIFVDPEGFGVTLSEETSRRKMDCITKMLPKALEVENFHISTVTCFACHSRSVEWLPHKIKGVLRQCVEECGWRMVWSTTIADIALIRTVEDMLKKGTLSPTIMIIANDGDFTDIARKVVESGRTIIVMGTQISARLARVAHRTLDIWKYLGDNPSESNFELPDLMQSRGLPFNTINIPDVVHE